MRKNKNIVIFFTVVFLVAVIINISPIRGEETKKAIVFSDLSRPQMNLALQNVLNKYNISITNSTNWKDNSDIKLKYSSALTEEEKANYDIYNLREENLYSVAQKGMGIKLNFDDIEKFLNANKEHFSDNILVFTPNTSKLFNTQDNNKPYVYDSLGKILKEDKTIIGILFESEIENMSDYDVNMIFKGSSEVKNNLCILIKKSIFNSDMEKNIFHDLKNDIDNLKGENDV
ncbi:hypothetical protein CSC2_42330 [Clostridium zeae]|uniref:Uncharacterized protein n=1 Tax=Clostridium zeae TaxID=2759022 RepID=A0ABQ1EFV6_9CLOT|nr:hypothetical protein [Clostridium zeae]GFZ33707.1 hypothetical protein CSC2_42330 [Clostridium zeae]